MRWFEFRHSAVANEGRSQWAVDLAVPHGGFGNELLLIDAFHRQQGIESRRGIERFHKDEHHVRWCFASIETARLFRAIFGGEIIDLRTAAPNPLQSPPYRRYLSA